MRVTTAQTQAMISGSLNRNGSAMAHLHAQMASGLRLQKPSDDPVASVRVLRLQREEAALDQYGKNIDNLSHRLAAQETGLKSGSEALLNLNDLLLWASNGANTAEDLRSMAGQMQSLEQSLVALFNGRDEDGRYRFAGTRTDTPALTFDPASGRYSLSGNDQHRQAAVANGVLVKENVTLHEVLGANPELLNDLHALVQTLQDPALDPADPAVQAQLKGMLGRVDDSHRALLGMMTELGSRQNHLSLLAEGNEDASIVHQNLREQLTALDYPKATVALAQHELAMQASQKTYLKIGALSLFNLM
ncbi:flagellar hook-associated protein FlgL [Pseudomonas sp. HR96]|uniref:flagellar hook-associated protein FlgL n=1 Tax=Pseudomonas sp. HR96 TaxID=1027966 RepID=UPI002A750701|nr:flagellar hook-associated protein FlgL [Pseudomonas sp. HR96]WPP00082.1 flagellar hook-associated protein FlgL [Pseudomonas sp. HR96]